MSAKKRFSRADGYSETDLLVSSRDHLLSALLFFEKGSLYGLDSAGYLAHLSIELLLKATLLFLREEFPESHDLGHLLDRVEAAGLRLRIPAAQEELVNRLKTFYGLRYPSPTTPVSISAPDAPLVAKAWDSLWDQLPMRLRKKMPEFYKPGKDGTFRKGDRVIMIRKKEPGDVT
jgi:HEPN domain-containing protein